MAAHKQSTALVKKKKINEEDQEEECGKLKQTEK